MKPYEYTGAIVHVGKVITVGTKGFKKRQIVICSDLEADYPDYCVLELKGGKKDNTGLVTEADLGKTATVKFFTDGRCWTDPSTNEKRWFTSNACVAVDFAGGESVAAEAPEPAEAPDAGAFVPQGDPENLPF